jgi:hypothetical protein
MRLHKINRRLRCRSTQSSALSGGEQEGFRLIFTSYGQAVEASWELLSDPPPRSGTQWWPGSKNFPKIMLGGLTQKTRVSVEGTGRDANGACQ